MDDFEKLLNKAFKFLSYRPRSEKEVRDYLIKKKADELTLTRITQSLKENNFLNDTDFAKWWIEQRTKFRPKAQRLIKLELIQKGIGKDLIDKLLQDKSIETLTDLDKAKRIAQKKLQRYKNEVPQKQYEKLVRFLASKGFNWDTIKKIVDQLIPKRYNKF
ncbi:MAG: regulatory protein RecX [Candidatus Levybacteria bacterium]|nr:regulatory protein RecX [Candidatus Levybacteria bacterium]